MAVAVRLMGAEDAPAVAELSTQLGYSSSEAEIRRRFVRLGDGDDAI